MSLMREKAQLMSASEIDRTLVRLAHEVLEKTKDLDLLAFIGIRRRGVPLAQRLANKIEALANNKAYVRCSRRLRSGARKATGLRRRGTGRSRPAATRAAHHFKRVGAAGPNCPREAMLRDLLLPCDWEDKGPYTVTVSAPTGRRPVNPRERGT